MLLLLQNLFTRGCSLVLARVVLHDVETFNIKTQIHQ